MKCKQLNKPKNKTAVFVVIILIVSFFVAWELPEVYGRYSEKKYLGGLEYHAVELEAYSYQYSSMKEKIEELMYYYYWGEGLELVKISIPDAGLQEEEKNHLKTMLQEEIYELAELNILPQSLSLEPYQLQAVTKYQIYPASSERMKGEISYWHIFLASEGGEDIIDAFMDTEFYKLYMLNITGDYAQKFAIARISEYSDEINQKLVRETIVEDLRNTSAQLSSNWISYYGLTDGQEVSWENRESYNIVSSMDAEESAIKDENVSIIGQSEWEKMMEEYEAELYDSADGIYEAVNTSNKGYIIKSAISVPCYIHLKESNTFFRVNTYIDLRGIYMSVSGF